MFFFFLSVFFLIFFFFLIFNFLLYNLELEHKRLTVTNTEKLRNELMSSINRQVPQRLLEIKFEHFSNTRETELKDIQRDREKEELVRVGLWLSW